MIERAFIHVAGQPGAGKTTLLEHLLRSNRTLLLSVLRTEHAAGLAEPEHSTRKDDAELGRLRLTGASAVGRLRCPLGEEIDHVVWDTDTVADYSQGVLIEGPLADEFPAALRVFVACTTPRGPRITKKHVAPPTSLEDLLRRARQTGRSDMLGEILRGGTVMTPTFAGAGSADLLVVNVRDPTERDRAAALVKEFRGLARGPHRSRPRRAEIANLMDVRDPGLKAVLATLKRTLRSAG